VAVREAETHLTSEDKRTTLAEADAKMAQNEVRRARDDQRAVIEKRALTDRTDVELGEARAENEMDAPSNAPTRRFAPRSLVASSW